MTLELSEREYPTRRLGPVALVIAISLAWGTVFGALAAVSIAFDPRIGDPSTLASTNAAALAMFPVGYLAALVPLSIILATGGVLGLAGSSLLATVPIFLMAFPVGVTHVVAVAGVVRLALAVRRKLTHRTST